MPPATAHAVSVLWKGKQTDLQRRVLHRVSVSVRKTMATVTYLGRKIEKRWGRFYILETKLRGFYSLKAAKRYVKRYLAK